MTEAKPKCFVDSNLWLYFFTEEQDSPKLQALQSLVRQNSICISTQVVNEVARNLLKKFGRSGAEVEKVIQFFFRKYTVISFDQDIILKAFKLRERYQSLSAILNGLERTLIINPQSPAPKEASLSIQLFSNPIKTLTISNELIFRHFYACCRPEGGNIGGQKAMNGKRPSFWTA